MDFCPVPFRTLVVPTAPAPLGTGVGPFRRYGAKTLTSGVLKASVKRSLLLVLSLFCSFGFFDNTTRFEILQLGVSITIILAGRVTKY